VNHFLGTTPNLAISFAILSMRVLHKNRPIRRWERRQY
jgi:hypothetical protein